MDGHRVKVYIYDLSQGMARAMSQAFLGKQLDGIWHTGIVVFGQEYFYGGTGGIECCPPGGTILGQPTRIQDLGQTHIPEDMFLGYLQDLSQSTFGPGSYHLLDHNCNTFSSEVAQFLTGNDIPAEITGLPAEVLSTPFGQMIRPFIDAMSVQPSGGHAIFPQSSAQTPAVHSSQNQNPNTPKANNQTQSKATTSSVPDKNQDASTGSKMIPFVHKVDIPDVSYWKSSEVNISSQERDHIAEMYEFLSQCDGTWSLGRDHIATLQKLALDFDTPVAKCALQIFSKVIHEEGIVEMLLHDPKSKFPELLYKFDGLSEDIKYHVIRMLTNCCSLECGHKLLTDKHPEQTAIICVSSLLSDNASLTESAVTFTYNLSLRKISDDSALELGSAILNCAGKSFSEETAYHLLGAILQLMKASEEVKGLAAVLGVDFNHFRGKTTRIDELCDNIAKLL